MTTWRDLYCGDLRTDDIGKRKVDCAAAAVLRLNPHVKVTPLAQRLDVDNAREIVAGYGSAVGDDPWSLVVGHDGVFKVTLLTLFDLPLERIALRPISPRDAARLLVVRPGGVAEDRAVRDLPELLQPGDAGVVNDTRVIPAREFFQGIMTTALREDELLVEARLPLLSDDTRCGFYEFSRRAGDFAMAACTVRRRVSTLKGLSRKCRTPLAAACSRFSLVARPLAPTTGSSGPAIAPIASAPPPAPTASTTTPRCG